MNETWHVNVSDSNFLFKGKPENNKSLSDDSSPSRPHLKASSPQPSNKSPPKEPFEQKLVRDYFRNFAAFY